ncbi:peptidoglycan-recognition protein LB-like isoform X2 [Choristoneura fumiferana]
MAGYILIVASMVAFASSLPLTPSPAQLPFIYYNKIDWGAQPARGGSELSLPVPYAVIHHSYIPGACFNFEECQQSMRWMQNFHMDTQGWTDIGYNFAVGSDGAVYEGRGWHTVGAHAFGYNVQSIGIVLIGDWVSNLPPPKQLQAVQELIAVGVKLGYISSNYHVIGHRQVAATECPGESLYQEISSWDRFLKHVPTKM